MPVTTKRTLASSSLLLLLGAWGCACPHMGLYLPEVPAEVLQPVEVPLKGSAAIWAADHFSLLCLIHKLAGSALSCHLSH